MNEGMKKRGNPWRCMTPVVIYLVLQNLASAAVILAYYAKEGFFRTSAGSAEELMSQVMSSTVENLGTLSFWAMILGYVILIPVFWHMHRKDLHQDRVLGYETAHGKVPAVLYVILIAAGAASCLAASNMISMSGLVETSENYAAAADTLYSAGLIPELIGLGVISPAAEELLFRGLVYRRFREFNSVVGSMIWASLLFALLHGNLVQGIYAFVSGFLMCYVYERYQSLKAPVVMHMASNLIAVLASETGVLDFMYAGQSVFYVSTFICCAVVVAMICLIELYVRPYTESVENTK
ncbi:MAG: CPBP family intramembrane metalloprotease [Lachnospiraceae bacterium]|nr:CPBP family intramembrane metalloprotease [Lachnospiraceae bacterium]MDY4969061.1 CPBP family intramembrane glutamic endopeptidase [Lachnospiraceae bacterium]